MFSSPANVIIEGESQPILFEAEDVNADICFLTYGGYMYFNDSLDRIVCLNAVRPVKPDEEFGLQFGAPLTWKPEWTRRFMDSGRFCPVALHEIKAAGATHVCWIRPNEVVGTCCDDGFSGAPICPYGGFAFIRYFEKKVVFGGDMKAMHMAEELLGTVEKHDSTCFQSGFLDDPKALLVQVVLTEVGGILSLPSQVCKLTKANVFDYLETVYQAVDRDAFYQALVKSAHELLHNYVYTFPVEIARDYENRVEVVQDIYDAFQIFDLDGDGYVTFEDMRSIMCEEGRNPLTSEELEVYADLFKDKPKLTICEYLKASMS